MGAITSGDKQKTLTDTTLTVLTVIIISPHNDKQAGSGNTFLLILMMMKRDPGLIAGGYWREGRGREGEREDVIRKLYSVQSQ